MSKNGLPPSGEEQIRKYTKNLASLTRKLNREFAVEEWNFIEIGSLLQQMGYATQSLCALYLVAMNTLVQEGQEYRILNLTGEMPANAIEPYIQDLLNKKYKRGTDGQE